MGNCISKNNQGGFEIDQVRVSNGKYTQGKGINEVERDHDATNFSHDKRRKFIGMQRHSVEYEPVNTNEIYHRPSPSPISFEIQPHNHTSHPLPPPKHPPSRPNHQRKSSFLPLPSPSCKESTSSKLQERLSISLVAQCILPMPASESEILSSPYLKSFSLDELRKATANFSEKRLLGEGGFGRIYKGWLDRETLAAMQDGLGMPVAIKKLIMSSSQGHNEWLSEVNYLGRIRHPNLVKLVGYCSHGRDRILVYQFLPEGSLEDHLFKKKFPTLSWAKRVKVAIGAAQGLCFLHEAESPVIFRDFKTSNILLDKNFNAKLSDFGLAKAGPTDFRTHVTTRVMGTEGYCDPYYLTTGKLSVKCDVYGFGVVLLELLSGRRIIDPTKCRDEKNLVKWAKNRILHTGKVYRIMDSKLEGKYCKKSAYIAANIALRCVYPEPKYRPSMTEIVEILENLPSQQKASTNCR